MAAALMATDIATASKFLKGATQVMLRNRLLPMWLDEEGRINKNADGKDLNWLIEYKEAVATDYTPGQTLTFNNDNYNISASATPVWSITTSGMNVTDVLMNSGQVVIVDNYRRRAPKLVNSLQIKFAKELYGDNTNTPTKFVGLGNFAKKSGTISCTNADRMAAPIAGVTYAGLDMSLGSQGGTWSNNITTALQMNTHLGNDWPDGQGSPDNTYDATSPRLYNEKTTTWITPGTPGDSTWRTNCIAMLSRANTDLRMNSVESMMPNIHLSGAQRYQDVKETLRLSFRDTFQNNAASENLGYHTALNLEGSAIDIDHECPGDRTYSVCAASMEVFFYGSPAEGGGRLAAGVGNDSQAITGGVFTTFGPERPAGSLDYVWIMMYGGFMRFQPKWVCVHKDFTI